MAVSLSKVSWMKVGVAVLVVANIGAAWPVYQKYNEDPMASITEFTPSGPQSVDMNVDKDTGAETTTIGLPPSTLFTWDPFKPPRSVHIAGAPGDPDEDTTVGGQGSQVMSIPTDNIKLLGIVSLNGVYTALLKFGDEPAVEVRRGSIVPVPDLDNVRCIAIRRDGVMLARPGALNTLVRLDRPEMSAQSWYRGDVDSSAIRGNIELRDRRRVR